MKTKKWPPPFKKFKVRENVILTNRVSNEEYTGDIIGEDLIDGRSFYIVRSGEKVFKLAKEGYDMRAKR